MQTNIQQIETLKAIIKQYVFEACELEDLGLKVELKKVSEYNIPEEFKNVLNKNAPLKIAFEALTSGRQKAYIFYFSHPKQSKTRNARVEKYIDPILNGKGLND